MQGRCLLDAHQQLCSRRNGCQRKLLQVCGPSVYLAAAAVADVFNSVFEAELADVIPICHCTIAGIRIIGRLTAGYVDPNDNSGPMAPGAKAYG